MDSDRGGGSAVSKRRRRRESPPGSGKEQLDALGVESVEVKKKKKKKKRRESLPGSGKEQLDALGVESVEVKKKKKKKKKKKRRESLPGSGKEHLDALGVESVEVKKKRRESPPGSGKERAGVNPTPSLNQDVGKIVSADSGRGEFCSGWLEVRDRNVRQLGSGKKVMGLMTDWEQIGETKVDRYVISVKTGEDIISKVKLFSLQGPDILWILSAEGAVTNASICTSSGASLTFKGCSQIVSLEGIFFLSPVNDRLWRRGGMTVYLAGRDGEVVGGYAPGTLLAANPMEVIAFSFHCYDTDSSGDESGHDLSLNKGKAAAIK